MSAYSCESRCLRRCRSFGMTSPSSSRCAVVQHDAGGRLVDLARLDADERGSRPCRSRPTPCTPAMVSRLPMSSIERHGHAVHRGRHALHPLDLAHTPAHRARRRRRLRQRVDVVRRLVPRDPRACRTRSSAPTGSRRCCTGSHFVVGTGDVADARVFDLFRPRHVPHARGRDRPGSSDRWRGPTRRCAPGRCPCRCSRGRWPYAFSIWAISTSFFAISGRPSAVASGYRSSYMRAGLQRRQDVVARELLAHVQHVAAARRRRPWRARESASARGPGRGRA